jgi:hypothetical protein
VLDPTGLPDNFGSDVNVAIRDGVLVVCKDAIVPDGSWRMRFSSQEVMASSTAQIAKVLNEADHNAADPMTAKMFLHALPHIFGGERHEFQIRLATMLRETLKQAREQQTGKQVSTTTSLDETKATTEKLQQEKSEAEAEAEKAKTIAEEKAAMLTAKQQITANEAQRHKETEAENEFVKKYHAELEESKNGIDSIVNGCLGMLVAGSWDSEEVRDDYLKPVMDYLQDMGCDKVLLAALPKALGCNPEKRGDFAKFSVDEAVNRLNEKVANITKNLEESKVKYEEANAENLGAWAIAEVARDAENAALDAKNTAEGHLHEATINGKLAMSKVDDIKMEVERILAEQSLIDAKIINIDAAVGEMDKLENEIVEPTTESVETNKENIDVASPAAKRIKLSESLPSPAVQAEIAPAIAVQ